MDNLCMRFGIQDDMAKLVFVSQLLLELVTCRFGTIYGIFGGDCFISCMVA